MNKYNSKEERTPFYYCYLGNKIDQGIEKVTARSVAEELGFKSPTSIVHDFMSIVDSPGTQNYGYNTTFLYNVLKKKMQLDDQVLTLLVIGDSLPFINDKTLQNRQIRVSGAVPEYDLSNPLCRDADLLVYTTKYKPVSFSDNIRGILNFYSEPIVDAPVPVENFDFTMLATTFWWRILMTMGIS